MNKERIVSETGDFLFGRRYGGLDLIAFTLTIAWGQEGGWNVPSAIVTWVVWAFVSGQIARRLALKDTQ